ncbi:unnamed protein product [Sphagnum balticum]
MKNEKKLDMRVLASFAAQTKMETANLAKNKITISSSSSSSSVNKNKDSVLDMSVADLDWSTVENREPFQLNRNLWLKIWEMEFDPLRPLLEAPWQKDNGFWCLLVLILITSAHLQSQTYICMI